MGKVYLAEDPLIGREVAIKVVTAEPDLSEQELGEIQARFQREFQSAGTLSHPNIVTVYDVGQEGDETFIAMEYLPGDNWSDILKSDRRLGFGEIADFATRMCSALDYAHAHGIVHRDIKPANILVARNGEPKLTDFGVAKLASTNLTRTGTVVGTPSYMPPEQITGQEVSGASDQFSIAVILYQMLTDTLPFTGENPTTILYKIVHEEPPEPRTQRGGLPEEVDAVLMKALAKKPEDRYSSCGELAARLSEALGLSTDALDLDFEHTQVIDPRSRPRRAPGRSSRRPLWIGLSVLLLALAGWAGWTQREALLGGLGGPTQPQLLTRSLTIESDKAGAAIWRNGSDTGLTTPSDIELSGTDGEEFTIELRREDHVVARTTLLLSEIMPVDWRPLEEVPAETFAVTSEPQGAEVYLNDDRMDGTTPLEIDLTIGEHYTMRVEYPEYHTESTAFTFPDSLDTGIRNSHRFFFPLRPRIPPGRLTLEADYPVRVQVDGRSFDQRRSHDIALKPGTYTVILSSQEVFLDETRQVTIQSSRALPLNLPPRVDVRVAAQPGNCRVFVNGRFVDETPFNLGVVPGSYEIRFEWPAINKSRSQLERVTRDTTQIFATPE